MKLCKATKEKAAWIASIMSAEMHMPASEETAVDYCINVVYDQMQTALRKRAEKVSAATNCDPSDEGGAA